MKRLIAEFPVGPLRIPCYETDEPILDDDGAPAAALITPGPNHEILIDAAAHGPERWFLIVHELMHARTVVLDQPETKHEEALCSTAALVLVHALGRYLGPPPGDRPARWPEPIDDDKTPTEPVVVAPVALPVSRGWRP